MTTNANNTNPAPFEAQRERFEKELTDQVETVDEYTEEMMKEDLMVIPLDLMVREMIRRQCPVIWGSSLGMLGRVIFVPAPLEVTRAQEERLIQRWEKTRVRTTKQPKPSEGGVGEATERQSVHHLRSERPNTREVTERSGPIVSGAEVESAPGVQGDQGGEHPVQEA